ncbi:MAG: hypothetical protein AOA65_2192 [Candidatus Bathyarchaeota archaeon BA1]|nr:MAG: hypothetical protein AOA65_2192 [Candidatus Bathyarchaeota archaeon BA1]
MILEFLASHMERNRKIKPSIYGPFRTSAIQVGPNEYKIIEVDKYELAVLKKDQPKFKRHLAIYLRHPKKMFTALKIPNHSSLSKLG